MPPDVAIVLSKKKPLFGDKLSGKSKDSEEDTDGSLEDEAFLAFAEAVADKDVKAMRDAWTSLPCPAQMRSSEEEEE